MEVELGLKLDKDIVYYHNMLINKGFKLLYPAYVTDFYYSKKDNFENLSENEIKKACKRVRFFQRFNFEENKFEDRLKEKEQLEKEGYKKVFQTSKFDFQYEKENSKFGCVQLQIIKDIGLLVYYDNKNYYDEELNKQRSLLIDDLNEIGFSFSYDVLGLDKLRTLYFKKEMTSLNQS